ncbi:WD40 repeat domain-containing serine/threonine protein kinase [Candidatus Oscillochloris fontis]|uniref:WD40 repeat domain-containing serine/threonine protein kinase n=1 Tax=Candidatus Oscillochloris fontis TaxID=2496868 RepID=UPI001290A99F|nr:serine/threonine-protein kinase [Candidatus Oscillochloris fontis]
MSIFSIQSLIGQTIEHYQIVEQLGEGGMATVYGAYDPRLDRMVALKVIRADLANGHEFLARFEREARALARLSHPHIVRIFSYGQYQQISYLIMEYLPGGTLRQRMTRIYDPAEAARLLVPIAHALHYAHQHHIIHRDVKPSNILFNADAEPQLSDFGIAAIAERDPSPGLTGVGMGVGTPAYMAPEQWHGQAGPASDLYALGVIFYELVTAQTPYPAETPAAIFLKQSTEPLPSPRRYNPSLSAQVEQVISTALAKDPADRYASLALFAHALEQIATAKPPPQRRFAWPIALVGLALVLLLVVGVWLALARTNMTAEIPIPTPSPVVPMQPTPTSRPTSPTPLPTLTPLPQTSTTVIAALQPTLQALFSIPDAREVISSENIDRLNIVNSISTDPDHNPQIWLMDLQWSYDGRYMGLVTGGQIMIDDVLEYVDGIQIYTAPDLQPVCSIPNNSINFAFVTHNWSFSHDSRLLAAVRSGQVVIWDVVNCQEYLALDPIDVALDFMLTFSPDDTLIAATSGDHSLYVWDVGTGNIVYHFAEHSNTIRGIAFSSDGKLLTSASDDGSIRIWDVATGTRLRVISSSISYRDTPIRFWPDDQSLAVGQKIYDRSTGQLKRTREGCCGPVSPDRRLMFSEAQFWDTAAWKSLRLLNSAAVRDGQPSFSPDGTLFVAAGNGAVEIWAIDPAR